MARIALQPGKEHIISAEVINAGPPAKTRVNCGISAYGFHVPYQEQQRIMESGERYNFEFPMAIPAEAGPGTGKIQLNIMDELGNTIDLRIFEIEI